VPLIGDTIWYLYVEKQVNVIRTNCQRNVECCCAEILSGHKRKTRGHSRLQGEIPAETWVGCVFPIWEEKKEELARSFIEAGFKAIICTTDSKKLGSSF
jgi:diphthamide synthase (EF-2-diphthine--ammonia ligase)